MPVLRRAAATSAWKILSSLILKGLLAGGSDLESLRASQAQLENSAFELAEALYGDEGQVADDVQENAQSAEVSTAPLTSAPAEDN